MKVLKKSVRGNFRARTSLICILLKISTDPGLLLLKIRHSHRFVAVVIQILIPFEITKNTVNYHFFVPSCDFCLCSITYRFSPRSLSAILKGALGMKLVNKRGLIGENCNLTIFCRISNFFSWVSRFSFTRGWQICSREI